MCLAGAGDLVNTSVITKLGMLFLHTEVLAAGIRWFLSRPAAPGGRYMG